MGQLGKIISILLLFLVLACEEDKRIIVDTTKNKSRSRIRAVNSNKPKVEFAKAPEQKKKVTYNNRLDVIINRFKLDNLKDEELEDYIKSLFTVYRDNVIDKFLNIHPVDFGKDYIVFKSDRTFTNAFEITIKSEEFIPEDHKLERHKDWYLYKIDDVPFLGTDGTLPSKHLNHIEVKINGHAIEFPKEAYQDLYEPNFCKYFSSEHDSEPEICYIKALISKDYKYLFILMEGGEAAGIYEVIWVFRLGQFYTRSINIPY